MTAPDAETPIDRAGHPMTSAEREARAKAARSIVWPGDFKSAHEAMFTAGAEYARGATVAEIVEALEVAYHPQNPIPDHPADFVERQFSEHPGGGTPMSEQAPGSAAVPSEPRRVYRARRCRDYGELHGVVDGCHCDMNEGFDVVTIEEVGPVSEAQARLTEWATGQREGSGG